MEAGLESASLTVRPDGPKHKAGLAGGFGGSLYCFLTAKSFQSEPRLVAAV